MCPVGARCSLPVVHRRVWKPSKHWSNPDRTCSETPTLARSSPPIATPQPQRGHSLAASRPPLCNPPVCPGSPLVWTAPLVPLLEQGHTYATSPTEHCTLCVPALWPTTSQVGPSAHNSLAGSRSRPNGHGPCVLYVSSMNSAALCQRTAISAFTQLWHQGPKTRQCAVYGVPQAFPSN